jgi:hypothetical protein
MMPIRTIPAAVSPMARNSYLKLGFPAGLLLPQHSNQHTTTDRPTRFLRCAAAAATPFGQVEQEDSGAL